MLRRLLARAATPAAGGGPWREVSLLLFDDAGIAAVNAAALSHEGPTDVITLPYAPQPGDPPGAVAEIAVNLELAARHARGAWTASHELALYIAHGVDHLAGNDDATPPQRARMRRRELRWLRGAVHPPLMQG